jgi:hypothetical protein
MMTILIIVLLIVGYMAIAMHSVSLVDDGKYVKIVWVTEKINTDGMPYTRVNSIIIWKY